MKRLLFVLAVFSIAMPSIAEQINLELENDCFCQTRTI